MPAGLPSGAPVVLLCDAAATTGLGHFVRCTALASALDTEGAAPRFLLPQDSVPTAARRVRAAGWPVGIGNWSPSSVADTAGPGGVVVVDSYRLDGGWLDELTALMAARGGRLAVVDDAADRTFRSHLVVNQNIGAERWPYPGAGQVLAGPRYALLRPEFPRLRERALAALEELPDRPRTVLVLFGGTDATGMAETAARAARLAFPDARVRAVLPGATGDDLDVEWLGHVEAIGEEMLAADLVVSAGGTTLWELCCLARAAAVVAVAANQRPAYELLGAHGAILPVGDVPVRDADELAGRLRVAVAPPGALRAAASAAARVTDGHGAARVAAALLDRRPPAADDGTGTVGEAVRVREAVEEDAELLLAWRNDPDARRWSRSSDAIDLESHRAWLVRTLASPDRHLLVVETPDGTPVATTRYDRLDADGRVWEVSISVGTGMRGRGLGGATLRVSDEWLLAAEPAAQRIVAHVRPANDSSRRLFERNGYGAAPSGEPDMLRFERPRDPGQVLK